MSNTERPTITSGRIREEVGTTLRGTGNALSVGGALSVVFGLASKGSAVDPTGMSASLSIVLGAGMFLTGLVGRYIGGQFLDIQRPAEQAKGTPAIPKNV